MSLFDVLKYPLSTPPTPLELIEIPDPVFWEYRHWQRANAEKITVEDCTSKLRAILEAYEEKQ